MAMLAERYPGMFGQQRQPGKPYLADPDNNRWAVDGQDLVRGPSDENGTSNRFYTPVGAVQNPVARIGSATIGGTPGTYKPGTYYAGTVAQAADEATNLRPYSLTASPLSGANAARVANAWLQAQASARPISGASRPGAVIDDGMRTDLSRLGLQVPKGHDRVVGFDPTAADWGRAGWGTYKQPKSSFLKDALSGLAPIASVALPAFGGALGSVLSRSVAVGGMTASQAASQALRAGVAAAGRMTPSTAARPVALSSVKRY